MILMLVGLDFSFSLFLGGGGGAFLTKLLLIYYGCRTGWRRGASALAYVDVRGQPEGLRSLLLPRGLQVLSLGHQLGGKHLLCHLAGP